MPKAPERAELTIESVGVRGDGIARLAGLKVFVPYTLPGERVEARIVGARPDGLAARVERWIAESPERVSPPCPQFGRCGGCALQHWSHEGYANWKVELLRTALRRQGLEAPIEPIRHTPPRARRRAGFVARFGGRGVTLGFRERGSHRIVSVAECPVLRPSLERFALDAPPMLAGLDPPNAEWALDASLTESGIDLLVTAAGAPSLAVREGLAALAAPQPIAIRRAPLLRFAEVAVEPPPGAFFQASAEGEAALIEEVLAMTQGARRIADLYAGLGTFTLPLAQSADAVLGVEGDEAALAALAAAARRGQLPVRTLARDLARDPLRAEELNAFDAVVLDPPRASSKVPAVAMVSCNPATFARDARMLTQGGFRLERVVPVDQFLWSPHLELAALLRR
jgi:23S rRNA (uracil1939-C5)-methyltransferase